MKTRNEIREEIITINYYMVEAMRKGDVKEVTKRKILLNNLIKLYLKSNEK